MRFWNPNTYACKANNTMRHHRTDEHGQPTDRSLLQGGYETPGLSPGLLRTVGVLAFVLMVACILLFS
ncbi:hypothetical protein MUN82_04045 [Hymenobacter aerilatus]|uniref:Uncharacterized protein n=1 Tax=Hymenobacter aerilatus TaxID=2932251 RepID=A0A8T9SY13_9BACT|nr:hypothetical protein [Hymenobacter aerilatus]UOR06271.1 hypothetical protein MUN82_04045 [Hymenobacter aerilatus]